MQVTTAAIATQERFYAKSSIAIRITIPEQGDLLLQAPTVHVNAGLSVPNNTALEVVVGECRE